MAEKSNEKEQKTETIETIKKPVEKAETKKPSEKKVEKVKNDDFVVVDINGSQEQVSKGTIVTVNKIEGEIESNITFDRVLLSYKSGKTEIGTPTIKGASVEARVLEQEKGPKIHSRTYKAKARYRRHKGHRQLLTKFEITKI